MESSSDRGTVRIRAHLAPGKSYFDRNRLFDLTHSSLRFAKDHITLLLMAATLLAAALNGFLIAYRTAIFKVLSYDDYAPYLLYVLGEPGGEIPHSPWVYRIGSIILAAPFYNLPLVSLNGGGAREIIASDTLFYLKATQAICFANLFYVSVSCLLIFAYCKTRLKLSNESCFIGSVLMFVLYQLTGLIGIDGIAALPLTIIAITVLERMTLSFVLSVLMAAFINEKIVLVAFLLVVLRLIFTKEDRRFYYVATGSAALSLFAIVAAVYVLHFPGNENHMNPSTYLTSTWRMLMSTFTLKGAYLSLWPVLLLVGLWVAGMTVPRRRRLVAVSDVGVIVGMVLIAFALGVDYNVGRIVIYSAALFVIVATQALAPLRHEEERAEETTSET